MSPLYNGPEVLSSESDKSSLYAENFSKNSNLDDSSISLPDYLSRTDLKLHDFKILKEYVARIVLPRGEFHHWVEFAPVSGQTYFSVYMFNRGEMSTLPLFRPCLQDGRNSPRG